MKSLFAAIDENRGVAFQSRRFDAAFARHGTLLRSVALTAAAVRTHFLTGPGWRCRIHEGSLTFIHTRSHVAVKVLVDLGNALAMRAGLAIEHDPVVVGVELTHVGPFLRELIRQYLHEMFGERYLDPRGPRPDSLAIVNNSKFWFVPHGDRFYDIVFVPPLGRIPLGADERLVELFEKRLRAQVGEKKQEG
jgi:hypothetical protein